ncbi:dihydrodipicolinate synthase family protein [Granulicella sp. WH15]|uniref:dihydrodipicolinate synthase family protein n=1 Tax=Granulicella sp. WH15 TaxID=2602070 RepID=UPI0013677E63|nr:dihydrodipicolinate synthase family protein [Granulicella sp. WH15]QHN04333.1 dihydrodipicolinate synthase family protein [Granulicella sp. WH15]
MTPLLHGTYAAVLTPRDADGSINEALFRSWLNFLISRGVDGFAINGATGEFCLVTEPEFDRLMQIVAETIQDHPSIRFVAGVGAAGSAAAIRLGNLAARAGATGLLLPMPYFFPYSQADVKSFSRTVAASVQAPILLYNLPQFTSPLAPATSLELIRDTDNIVGIKDSSGSLDTLRLLTSEGIPATRIVGNDGALAQALVERVTDGVISGVACALPELMTQLYRMGCIDPLATSFEHLVASLKLFIAQLDPFPTPWGLKIIAEARNLAPATFPFPLAPERVLQTAQFTAWFAEHRSELQVQ